MSIADYTLGAHRHTPVNAATLDDFPTPPWAVRAMMEQVLMDLPGFDFSEVWEPTCNRGYMAAALAEYFLKVHATDVADYGFGKGTSNFLDPEDPKFVVPWIIANPPFKLWMEFVTEALKHATQGVAMFGRTQVLAGEARYQNIFKDNPPTLVAHHVYRVRCVQGQFDPNQAASTRTDYAWYLWVKDHAPLPPMWIDARWQEYQREDDINLPSKMLELERIEQRPRVWSNSC